MEGERMFPVHPETRRHYPNAPVSVPWRLLEPHEAWAELNHSQTLQRLAERGGLSAGEIRCVVEHRRWRTVKHDGGAEKEHVEWLIAWLSSPPATKTKGGA